MLPRALRRERHPVALRRPGYLELTQAAEKRGVRHGHPLPGGTHHAFQVRPCLKLPPAECKRAGHEGEFLAIGTSGEAQNIA